MLEKIFWGQIWYRNFHPHIKNGVYEKFGTEISATGAIKLLEFAKKKKGGKYYLTGRFVQKDTIYSSIGEYRRTFDKNWSDKYHNIAIFTEVSKYYLSILIP